MKYTDSKKVLSLKRRDVLKKFPKNLVTCEIGVLNGFFSGKILKETSPSKLYLIDPWKHIETDAEYKFDKANSEDAVQEARYQSVLQKFKTQINSGQVEILRGLSNEKIPTLGDNSLDWCYIDGDHGYEGCLSDLRLMSSKIKESGFIMGHDYTINKFISVPNSIETFLNENKEWKFFAITSEPGFPSYFLCRNEKNLAFLE